MKKTPLYFVFALPFILFIYISEISAQSFVNIGNASNSGGGCYILTPDLTWQQGTAWYTTPIDLSQSLTIQYNLNFGNLDANGADGIAFVLQNQGTAVIGGAGIGIGYQGISPSLVVEFDDWKNAFDPVNDHVAVTLNGDPDHTSAGNAGSPLVSFPFNIEDGNWHTVQITWDAPMHTLQVYYDCQLWLTYTNDVVNTIFGGNPIVWWGFTSGTGIRTNLHQFCFTPPLILTKNITNVSCKGLCDGNAAVTNVSGGTAPYTYLWSNGQTTSAATGLCPGTYTFVVTSFQGCVTTDSVVITEPAALIAGASVLNNVSCFGGNDGSANSSAAGGISSYSYLWSNGETTQVVTSLSAGTHTVTVTDNNGCIATQTVTITDPPPLASINSQVDVLCNGGNNGAAAVTISGGTSPYIYQWNNGQTATASTGLIAGSYSVLVTDVNNCTYTASFTITEPPALTLTAGSTDEFCNRADGTVMVTPAGGSGSYAYSWSTNPVQTTSAVTGLVAGNYSVTITDANGCTHDTMLVVNFIQGPVANAGSDITVCSGQSVSLTANGGGSYSWSPAAGLSNATSSNPSVVSSASTTYTVVVTDINGCTATDTQAVTVNPLPTANFSSTNVCVNSPPAVFTDQSVGALQWDWNFGDGTPHSSQQNTSHIYGAPGTYSVTLLVQDGAGCMDSIVQTISINPVPDAIFTFTTVCLNNPTVFTDQSLGAPLQWDWDFGDGAASTLQHPSHTYNAPGSYTVTLIATNSSGCKDTLPLVVTVNPFPAANFTAPTVCIGSPTCFTDNTIIASGVITGWSWNFSDPNSGPNNISTIQHPCHVFSTAGIYNVILTVTSNNGCQNTVNLPVTVSVPPVAAFTSSSVCMNTPTIFTDGSTGALQWYWNFGDGGTSTAQSPTHMYLGYGTYLVTLVVSSGGNCNDTITDTVTVNSLPIVSFKADSVCVGNITTFTDLSFIPSGNISSWNWNFGDSASGINTISSLQNPTHIFSSSGNYSVLLTAISSAGCINSKVHSVFVFPRPIAEFSSDHGSEATLIDMVGFNDLSTGFPVQWWWDFGDGDTSIVQHPFHSYSDMGTYIVTLIVVAQNGCVDTVQHLFEIKDFAFYIPNAFTPNGDNKNDFFFGKGIGIVEYEMYIFDRWGNRIFYCKINDLPQSLPCMWNGEVEAGASGETVQQDVYVWKVRLTNVFEEVIHYTGHVTVIR